MTTDDTLTALREAIEYAPPSGPVAPDLRGLWVPSTPDATWYVCAECVGRITARGCGYVLKGADRVWKDDATPYGICCTCGK